MEFTPFSFPTRANEDAQAAGPGVKEEGEEKPFFLKKPSKPLHWIIKLAIILASFISRLREPDPFTRWRSAVPFVILTKKTLAKAMA